MRTRLVLVAAAAAALLTPAVAAAAPVTIGTGAHPRVQMDPAGTSYVVYEPQGDLTNVAVVCALPLRGKACVPGGAIPPFGSDGLAEIRTLQLLRRPADGALIVVASLFDSNDSFQVADSPYTTWQSTSLDNGATWSPALKIGEGQEALEDVSLTPDGLAINAVGGDPSYAQFSRLPLAGPPTPVAIDLSPGDQINTYESITTQPDGGVIVGFRYDTRWGMARLPAGADPAAGWIPWKKAGKVAAGETDQELVTGPRGTYTIAQRNIFTQIRRRTPLLLRRVTAKGVTKGTRIGQGSTNIASGLAIDALGGLHATYWQRGSYDVRYLRTRGPRGRCSFGRQTSQVRVADYPQELEMSAVTPKRAVVVYVEHDSGVIQAVSLRGGDRPKPPRKRKC